MTVIMAYAPQLWQLSDIHCDAPRLVRGQPGQVEELLGFYRHAVLLNPKGV
jgi:hypothetical protein